MNYKIHIHDRKYSDWSFFDENNQIVDSPFSSDFHPSHYKLYHNDGLSYLQTIRIVNYLNPIVYVLALFLLTLNYFLYHIKKHYKNITRGNHSQFMPPRQTVRSS